MFSVYSLEGEWNRYNSWYGGSVGYGGAQAGTGTGGVDGAGVITISQRGDVVTGNGEEFRLVQPDGTVMTIAALDGMTVKDCKTPDGTWSRVFCVPHLNMVISYLVRPDGLVRMTMAVTERNGVAESELIVFPDQRVSMTVRNLTTGVSSTEEFAADGKIVAYSETDEKGLKKEARLASNGFVDVRWSYPVGYFDKNPEHEMDSWAEGLDFSRAMRRAEVASVETTTKIEADSPLSVLATVEGTFKYGDGRTEVLAKKYAVKFHQDRPLVAVSASNEDLKKGIDLICSMVDMLTASETEDQTVQKRGVMELGSALEKYFVNAHIGTSSDDRIEGDGLLAGGWGGDVLFGGAQGDILYGGDGTDFLYGRAGGDILIGGAGFDYASYTSAVVARLSNPSGNTGEAAGDIYDGIEGLQGSAYNDTLGGNRYGNNLFGRAGHDTLFGEGGNDALSGEDGSDNLVGGAGGDLLDGSTGFDYAGYFTASSGVVVDLLDGRRNTGDARGDFYASIEGIGGSEYKDELSGDHAGNELYGNGGDDTLEGRGGADLLHGGLGYDFASYSTADAAVMANLAESWRNTSEAAGDSYNSIEGLHGSAFGDGLTGSSASNDIYGHGGDDWLFGLASGDYLVGGAGSDVLNGGAGADGLVGGSGYDYASYEWAGSDVVARLSNISGNTGDAAGDTYDSIEALHGSAYNDTLGGDHFGNYLFGRAGHDMIHGEDGNDFLFGEDGSDNLVGGADADQLNGGGGFDYAGYFTAASGVVVDMLRAWRNTGDAAGDSYIAIEGIGGSAYNDELSGDHVGNELYGNGGNDVLEGRGGADYLDGGAGYDWASYSQAAAGVTANLLESWRNTGDAAGDRYVSIDALNGSQYSDSLTGNQDGNSLYGQDGNDLLRGLGGWDYLTGGAGSDTFRFDTALNAWNVDEITDFTAGVDKLQLGLNVFTAFTYQGAVSASQFAVGPVATSASHRLIYNSATGAVFYDADGVGGQAQVQFASIGGYRALSANDFSLI